MSNPESIDYIFTPNAIRERCQKIFDLTLKGETNFQYHEEKLQEVAELVLEVIKENYPDLKIPFHSRWGHFQVGGVDRNSKFDLQLSNVDALEKARCKLDLVITSVLLDAGAGPAWKFLEDGRTFNRSEGLAVASWHMFLEGQFSNERKLSADAKRMQEVSKSDIAKSFQVSESNPLVGLEGRTKLINELGQCVANNSKVFKDARPGNIVDYMIETHGESFDAKHLLQAVLYHFGDIWPSRIRLDGINLGDVWYHPKLGEKSSLKSLVPFHKLSQWLTYSLIEPIEEAGIKVNNVSEMTGLAEYRNGGLLVDSGLISLKDNTLYSKSHKPDSELIIEWRALTVIVLDKLADIIRKKLNFSEEDFPLAKVLEGGTWWAGRRLAKEKRADSSPPISLDSDGTVF